MPRMRRHIYHLYAIVLCAALHLQTASLAVVHATTTTTASDTAVSSTLSPSRSRSDVAHVYNSASMVVRRGDDEQAVGEGDRLLLPGSILEGYELVERTSLLGVCSPHGDLRASRRKSIGDNDSATKNGNQQLPMERNDVEAEGAMNGAVVVVRGERTPRLNDKNGNGNQQGGDKRVVEVALTEVVAVTGGVYEYKYQYEYDASAGEKGDEASSSSSSSLVPDGPSLEYQCLHEDIDLIYINSNYRLKRKFAAGSHGEVWRATRPRIHDTNSGEMDKTYILKRLFLEKGELMVEMGLREAYFGKLLRHEAHVTKFVEYFFRGGSRGGGRGATTNDDGTTTTTPPNERHPLEAATSLPGSASASGATKTAAPAQVDEEKEELWLVFHDEGISLREYLYASRDDSAHSAVVFEASPFWHKLRMDDHGEQVLGEILRQLLEGVAALHDKGITHRDIKPSNILVHLEQQPHYDATADDNESEPKLTPPVVKLADFGSAVDEYTLRHLYGAAGPTQVEETREYQPPEVLFSDYGVPYDFANPLAYDLWSVGVVFLEIVLGSPQVFMISPRARAKLDATLLRNKATSTPMDEATRLKRYLLHVLTQEFCIFQPTPYELHKLWNQYALVSDGCHFGRFNTSIVTRDPMGTGLRNPWGLDLMWKLLQWTPSQRISAREALNHAFFKGPYTCSDTNRQFATQQELDLHRAYLTTQRARDQAMAFVVRGKYELPTAFTCPQCRRVFSTIGSCENHMAARKHGRHTHFCEYDHSKLGHAIREETNQQMSSANDSRLLLMDYEEDKDANDRAHGKKKKTKSKTSVGIALLQGKKKYMEDFVVVQRLPQYNASVYAVMDGHLGTSAAEYVRTHLLQLLQDKLAALSESTNTSGHEDDDDKEAQEEIVLFVERVVMRQLFLELHHGFLAQQSQGHDDMEMGMNDFSGCTLTLVIHFETQERLLCANIGDSRAVFVSHGDRAKVTVLSTDHWPNVPQERTRIESSGGFISYEGLWRVVGQLAVSRSIGDRHLRQYVTAEPSITSFKLPTGGGGGGILVVASDGVWDTVENEDALHLVMDGNTTANQSKNEPQKLAEEIIQEAFLRGSLDNLAAVVVAIPAPPSPPT